MNPTIDFSCSNVRSWCRMGSRVRGPRIRCGYRMGSRVRGLACVGLAWTVGQQLMSWRLRSELSSSAVRILLEDSQRVFSLGFRKLCRGWYRFRIEKRKGRTCSSVSEAPAIVKEPEASRHIWEWGKKHSRFFELECFPLRFAESGVL